MLAMFMCLLDLLWLYLQVTWESTRPRLIEKAAQTQRQEAPAGRFLTAPVAHRSQRTIRTELFCTGWNHALRIPVWHEISTG